MIDNILVYLNQINSLVKSSKTKILFLTLILTLVALVDLLGIGLVYPYIEFLSNQEKLQQLTNYIDKYIVLSKNIVLILISLLFLFVLLLKTTLGIYLNFLIFKFSQEQQVKLRKDLMFNYQNLDYQEFIKRNCSEFIFNVQTLTVQFSSGVVTTVLQLFSELLIVTLIFLFFLIKFGFNFIFILIPLVITIFAYDKIFGKKNRIYGMKTNEEGTKVGKYLSEAMRGFIEIRLYGKESLLYSLLSNSAVKYSNYNLKQSVITNSPRYVVEFMGLSVFVIFISSTIISGLNINDVLPSIGIFLFAGVRLLPSFNRISGNISKLRYNRDAVNRLFAEKNSSFSKLRYKRMESNLSFESLELKEIHFSFPQRNLLVINGLNLFIKKGNAIGIYGESGSGKSTLVKIISGLLSPDAGEIIFNSSMNNDAKLFQSKIAYIPQNSFLLDNTLCMNITLTENKVNEKLLNKAVLYSNLNSFIEKLPLGLETIVGEDGVQLSGGQRQRIAIARALYHNKELLIMDESTSSLDNDSEHHINETILNIKRNVTVLIISHKLSAFKYCDNIYEFKNGKLKPSKNTLL